jgi:hypothetical protein
MKVLSKLSFQGLLVLVSQEDPLDKGRFLKVPAVLDATAFWGLKASSVAFDAFPQKHLQSVAPFRLMMALPLSAQRALHQHAPTTRVLLAEQGVL